ncbi:MAG: insulinase family protein [Oscillospiraceae bacterium]|jgi:predicted Zn-dependent peptidase|nr:insulinase family protein [Oscillospiraceae bacterium]
MQEIIRDIKTNAEYIKIKHKSGLTILVWEMEGFSSSMALFGTKYGSVNTTFKTKADKEYTSVPEGIAHFLEHKLFENEDCDVFELYAKTGANANAFTSFDKTAYLFTCTGNFKESLKILLDFVQAPYFTKESVDKEQGIIGQEIQMTNDNPNWKVFFNLLDSLYFEHPVKIDIAGTKESIAKIDADLLYKCYNTFYNLNNMVLSVAGNVKVADILEIADSCLKDSPDLEIETVFPKEDLNIVRKTTEHIQPVGLPIFNFGYKMQPYDGIDKLKAETITNIIADILTDTASPFYKTMSDRGLINSSFDCEVFTVDDVFTLIFAGESNDPYTLYKELNKVIDEAKVKGLDKVHFENLRRENYGSHIKQFNNVNSVAEMLLADYFADVNSFDVLNILRELKFEEVQDFLVNNIDTARSAVSIVASKHIEVSI